MVFYACRGPSLGQSYFIDCHISLSRYLVIIGGMGLFPLFLLTFNIVFMVSMHLTEQNTTVYLLC